MTDAMESTSLKCEQDLNVKKSPQLQSILVNHLGEDDEDYFHGQSFRPRANTDPISPKPVDLHVRFDLPDIVVDDCSDNDEDYVDSSKPEEINKDLRNTDTGAFFVFKSPPRQRANTCPTNMFSRRKLRNRPPTPPPNDKVPKDGFPRYPSWEKVSFNPHPLSRVTEDTENAKQIKSTSPPRSRRQLQNFGDVKAKVGSLPRRKLLTDSPSESPKRTGSKLPNGHVSTKSRDGIHSAT